MKNGLSEIFSGLMSLFKGMWITLRQFFKPAVTVCYPYETLKIPPRFRGHIELVRDPATGQPKCFVCKLCEKACPSDCITVEGVKPEGARRKTVTMYRLDFTKCSLCGSCVEACRDGAIRFSLEYNLAGTHKEDFIMDLFKRLEAQHVVAAVAASDAGSPEGKAKPGAAPVQPVTVAPASAGGAATPKPLEPSLEAK